MRWAEKEGKGDADNAQIDTANRRFGGEGIKEERNGDLFWKQWQWNNNNVCVKDGRGRGL